MSDIHVHSSAKSVIEQLNKLNYRMSKEITAEENLEQKLRRYPSCQNSTPNQTGTTVNLDSLP
jgi:hypothetical protein